MGEHSIIFVVGGAASGKSKFAIKIAKNRGRKIVFVATCIPQDSEMHRKITRHKRERPAHWKTIEAAATPFRIRWPRAPVDCLLVDSLTLWVSNLMMHGLGLRRIKKSLKRFLNQARKKYKTTIVVSDEVGLGIVPENRIARNFRELLGEINQATAQLSQEVFGVSSGLSVQLKGKSGD